MAPNNPLAIHGNEKTMNLNTLILTNIQSSPYFKVKLFELKTYHQVIDEIYYKVEHLEPWEKGSRKTAGQTGMCGGVRGVGAGGIVSSAYCLLYKLYTLKLTRKQLIGLITHQDSPYIRGLGFMYIRYTQNPADLWEWYEEYLEDEEEFDVKAGGGHVMPMGEVVKQFLCKLEWYSTLFPRIPVPIQKSIESKMREHNSRKGIVDKPVSAPVAPTNEPDDTQDPRSRPRDGRNHQADCGFGEAERYSNLRDSPQRSGGNDHHRNARATPPFDIAKVMDRDRLAVRPSSDSHDRPPANPRDRPLTDGRDRPLTDGRDRPLTDGRDRPLTDGRDRPRRSPSRERERDRQQRRRSRSRDRGNHKSHRGDRHRSVSRERRDKHRRSRSRERGHHESSDRGHHESSDRGHRESLDRGHRESSDRGHRETSYRGHKHSSDRSHHQTTGHRESSFDRDLRRERDRVRNGR